jgi:phenylalanyl-tRNA synthetase beta chain
VTPNDEAKWLEPGGDISINGAVIGRVGRLNSTIQSPWDVRGSIHVAQLHLGALLTAFPPEIRSQPLPKQPAIERDVSAIVDESVLWSDMYDAIAALKLEYLEDIGYVTTFRGKNIEEGKKSVTLRLRFRDAKRTLTHEEVNSPVAMATEALITTCCAEIRS